MQYFSLLQNINHYSNIEWKNKWINHMCKVMSKRHNVLSTIASFFISSAGRIEDIRQFLITFFKWMPHCGWHSYKNHLLTYSSFQRKRYFVFLRSCPFIKTLLNKITLKLLWFIQLHKSNRYTNFHIFVCPR